MHDADTWIERSVGLIMMRAAGDINLVGSASSLFSLQAPMINWIVGLSEKMMLASQGNMTVPRFFTTGFGFATLYRPELRNMH